MQNHRNRKQTSNNNKNKLDPFCLFHINPASLAFCLSFLPSLSFAGVMVQGEDLLLACYWRRVRGVRIVTPPPHAVRAAKFLVPQRNESIVVLCDWYRRAFPMLGIPRGQGLHGVGIEQ